jgi:hypothetical protein
MATMQEYLEEMARRQATGWTPGVPNRFAIPVSTTWNLPSTARTTMRQAVPKANLGDISAQSNPQSTTKRRGRPRTTAEKLQSISDRAGTGTIKPMLGAISKIAGPAAFLYDALRPSQVAMADVPTDVPGYSLADPTVTWSPDQGAAINEAKVQELAGTQTGMPVAMDASPNIMDPLNDVQPITDFIAEVPTATDSTPYAGPSRTVVAPDYSISQDVQTDADINDVYRHAGMVYGPTDLGGAFGPFGDPVTGLENTRPSDIMRLTPFDTVRDTMLGYHDSYENIAANQGNLGPTQVEQQLRDLVNNTVFQDLRDSGTPLATAVQSPNVVWDTSAGPMSRQAGAMPSMIGNNMGAMARLVMDDYYAPQNVSINNLAGTGPSLFDSIDEIANQVDTFSSPLASPDISVQAMIDEATARQIAQDMALPDEQQRMLASNVPSVPVPAAPVSAPMAPRQDAMPTVSVPAPTAPAQSAGPSAAEIERQKQAAINARLAQQAAARLQEQQAAAAQAQAASQAQAAQAQAQAQAYIDWASGRDRGVNERELAAAIEVMSGVDSFGSGGMRNTRGEVGMDETGYTDTSGYGVG